MHFLNFVNVNVVLGIVSAIFANISIGYITFYLVIHLTNASMCVSVSAFSALKEEGILRVPGNAGRVKVKNPPLLFLG